MTLEFVGVVQLKFEPAIFELSIMEVVCPEQSIETGALICNTGSGVTLKTRLTGTPGQLLAEGAMV